MLFRPKGSLATTVIVMKHEERAIAFTLAARFERLKPAIHYVHRAEPMSPTGIT
jgi:hypothetical protein